MKIILLIILALSISISPLTVNATSDCDLYTKPMAEEQLRNDPLFEIFLEKYPNAVFYDTISESLPPLGEYAFDYYSNDTRMPESSLAVTTDECNVIEEYTLNLSSETYSFYPDTSPRFGNSTYVDAQPIGEIADEVYSLVFADSEKPDNTIDDLSVKDKSQMYEKQLWVNIRGENVCINSTSVETLLERGYLDMLIFLIKNCA